MPLPHATVLDSILDRCDRTRSAEARDALSAILWARAERAGLALSPDCILSRDADILAAQEAAKAALSVTLWRCLLCGKHFLSELFLDKHLARRHAGLRTSGHVCLADLCGVYVPCVPRSQQLLPPVSARLLRDGAPHDGPTQIADPSPCRDRVARRAARHACAHVVQECLGTLKGALHDPRLLRHQWFLEKHLCAAAIAVECTRPERRLAKFGPPSDRYGDTFAHMRVLGWVLVASFVVVSIAARMWGWGSTERHRQSRKRKSF